MLTMLFFDADDRPFILEGPEELVLVSECHELPVVPEPELTGPYLAARGGRTVRYAVCPRCGVYQTRGNGSCYPATDRPTATLADVRRAINEEGL